MLKLDRSKATLLLEGAVDRAGVYQDAEHQIDKLIDAHITQIEQGIRKLRQEEVGVDAANAEQERGGKTDEQYAEEAAAKRDSREKARQEAKAQERALAEERKEKERELRRAEEERITLDREKRAKDRALRDQEEQTSRTTERDRRRDSNRDESRYREREDERDYNYDRDRKRERDRDQNSQEVYEKSSRPRLTTSSKVQITEDESARLEEEALHDLLRESERTVHRSRTHLGRDRDASLAPRPRKLAPASAIVPISSIRKVSAPKAVIERTRSQSPKIDANPESDSIFNKSKPVDAIANPNGSGIGMGDAARPRRHSRERRSISRESHSRYDTASKRKESVRHRSYRSRSRSRDRMKKDSLSKLERVKATEALHREQEAKAYLAAQRDAKETGASREDQSDPSSKTKRPREDNIFSPTSTRNHDRVKSTRGRSRSLSPGYRREPRAQRSTSPTNIDRYVPKSVSHVPRHDSTAARSPTRHRHRDDRRRYRSRSRSHSRSPDRARRLSRSRSRDRRRDYRSSRDERRAGHRTRDEEKDYRRRHRSRTRSRSRKRVRSRSREYYRDRERDRERDRGERDRAKRARSRSPRRDRDGR